VGINFWKKTNDDYERFKKSSLKMDKSRPLEQLVSFSIDSKSDYWRNILDEIIDCEDEPIDKIIKHHVGNLSTNSIKWLIARYGKQTNRKDCYAYRKEMERPM